MLIKYLPNAPVPLYNFAGIIIGLPAWSEDNIPPTSNIQLFPRFRQKGHWRMNGVEDIIALSQGDGILISLG